MRFLLEATGAATLDDLHVAARQARGVGLDGVLVAASAALPAPLVAAAALAGATDDVLIAAEVYLGDRHPLEVAEEAAVVDQAAAGRLIVVVKPALGAEEHFDEALDLLCAAGAARPFEASGGRWNVPARLPEHSVGAERRVRVMPPPFGPALSLWVAAPRVRSAVARGLGHVADAATDEAELAQQWAEVGRPSPLVARVRREPATDAHALLSRLRAGRAAFGQDWAIVTGPAAAAAASAAQARPRLQLDALPAGLHEFWCQGNRTVG